MGFLLGRILNEYEIDTVFHLAAQSLVAIAARGPLSTFESNIRGTWTVLEQCRLTGNVKRIIVSTSDKVYGDQESEGVAENAPLMGLYTYDASKVCADVIARAYAVSFDLPVGVVRFANIYGGGDLNYSRIIPYAVRSVLLGQPVLLRSDGSHLREYLYVGDAVSAFLVAASGLDRAEVRGGAFNFGSGEVIDALTLVRRIAKLAGKNGHPIQTGQGSVAGEIRRQSLDSNKAARVLGWHARVPLDSGLRTTIDSYRQYFGA